MHVNQSKSSSNSDNHRRFSFIMWLSLAQLYSRLCFYWSCEGVSQNAAVKVHLTALHSIAYLCMSWSQVCFSSFQSSWTLYFSGFGIMRFLVCLVFTLFLIQPSLVLGSLCVPLPPQFYLHVRVVSVSCLRGCLGSPFSSVKLVCLSSGPCVNYFLFSSWVLVPLQHVQLHFLCLLRQILFSHVSHLLPVPLTSCLYIASFVLYHDLPHGSHALSRFPFVK